MSILLSQHTSNTYMLLSVWKRKKLALTVIASAFLITLPVSAEEECRSSTRIRCYECDSWSDHRCKDPFNETLSLQEPVLLKRCEGCCVKIVTMQDTPLETIKRTCTSNLQINLFLLDHVCMKESEGRGTLCFCESESCNQAFVVRGSVWTWLVILVLSLKYSSL